MKILSKHQTQAFISIIFLSIFHSFVLAQAPTLTPVFSDEELQRVQQASNEFYRRESENFAFSDFTVVYLVASDLPDTVKIAAPAAVDERFSAQIAHSWRDVEAILIESPIDILFIHGSATDETDRDWVRQAYRDGTMIVGLSTPFETLAQIADDRCAKNEAPSIPERYTEWYLYLIYWSQATPPEGKPIVDADILEHCSEQFAGLEGASSTYGTAYAGLNEGLGLEDIASFLEGHILNRRQQRLPMPSQME